MKLSHTRAMVRAALSGALDGARFGKDPVFGFEVPAAVPDVPAGVLVPRSAPGPIRRPTMSRRGIWRACSARTSSSSVAQVSEAVAAAGPAV